jgi:arylsulfatase A-like enzyme
MIIRLLYCSLFCLLFSCSAEEDKAAPPPNIIYILADDLGYGELGIQGQEIIETPHLDALAAGGMRFTQHYSGAPVCAPARGVLLMGRHSGHAHVRGNDEDSSRGNVWDFQAMFDDPALEGQRPIPDSLVTLGEVLQGAGYITGLVGKWGLGAPGSEGTPNKQGFDYFYGYNCQRQAHNLYPTHLWENEERAYLKNELIAPHVLREQAEGESDNDFFNGFIQQDYAPDLMQQKSIDFLRENADTSFFLYYASPLPHVPLQAPEKWVNYYREKIGEEEPYRGKYYFPCQYPRATYAAMISTLDEQVGELVAELKELGIYENTLIIFTSDNGATYAGGADTPYFDSNRPFRTEHGYGKGYLHEGGIRAPMIAHWPNRIGEGTVSDHISAFQDVMPTLAELANVEAPMGDGISFLPALVRGQQKSHDYLYWEFPAYNGQQAIRMGKWKGLRKDMHDGNLSIALYDLEEDPREERDLSANYPQIVQQIDSLMKANHTRSPVERFQFSVLGD